MKWWEIILMVLGITFLAALFVPQVSTHHGDPTGRRASIMQYSNYVNALQLFRGEYKDYPSIFDENGKLHLGVHPNSQLLIEALSGLNGDGEPIAAHGNKRAIRFHSFTESEITLIAGYPQIIDRSENTQIVLCIDHDKDGVISVPDGSETKDIRAWATAYSLDEVGNIAIKMWD